MVGMVLQGFGSPYSRVHPLRIFGVPTMNGRAILVAIAIGFAALLIATLIIEIAF